MNLKDEVAKVAYELYEKDGKRDGKDQEHWLEAERIVKARRGEAKQEKTGSETQVAAEVKKATPRKPAVPAKKAQEAPKPKAAVAPGPEKKANRTPRSK